MALCQYELNGSVNVVQIPDQIHAAYDVLGLVNVKSTISKKN